VAQFERTGVRLISRVCPRDAYQCALASAYKEPGLNARFLRQALNRQLKT
jgi:hypothetical protein